MTIFGVDDFVQSLQSFVETYDIVQDFFVDLMGVLQLAQVDALRRANDLDFGGVCTSTCQSLCDEQPNDITYESLHRRRI